MALVCKFSFMGEISMPSKGAEEYALILSYVNKLHTGTDVVAVAAAA